MRQLLPGRDLGHGMLLELLGTQGRFNVEILGTASDFCPHIRATDQKPKSRNKNLLGKRPEFY